MKPHPNSEAPLRSRLSDLSLLGSLYFAQGLPFGFFAQALPVLMRKRGFSLGQIGLTALLALPWALKFLWAPAVDRYGSVRFGRRRSWIVALQVVMVLLLVALALAPTPMSTTVLMAAVLLLNLAAATQDIATDALAIDLLAPAERGFGNGVQVAGYRVGMIAGGGVLLALTDRLGTSAIFVAMAVLTVAASLPVVARREPSPAVAITRPAAPTARPPHFLWRPGGGRLLLLIAVYKAGEAFATGMLRPFLVDRGLGLAEIGWLLGTAGFVAGLVGALCGGALVNRLGRKRSLVAFGLLQVATVAGYAFVAMGRPGPLALYLVCAAEHFAGGMATAALFTCMMDWSAPEVGATDYTVQASVVVVATGTASALAGFSAQALGYVGHFWLATGAAAAAVAVVLALFPAASNAKTVPAITTEVVPCA